MRAIELSPSIHAVNAYDAVYLATKRMMKMVNFNSKPTRIVDIYIPSTANDGYSRMKLRRFNFADGRSWSLQIVKEQLETDHWVKTFLRLRPDEYEALRTSFGRRDGFKRTIKDRYKVTIGGHPAHVYVYMGHLSGLVTVAFKNMDRKQYSDLKSDYADGELYYLTDPKSNDFNGCAVAGLHYHDIEESLAELGYQKINPAKYGLRCK